MDLTRWLLAVAGTLALNSPAGAVTFNLMDSGGAAVGTQARAGYETAAAFWSSLLSDDVTLNVSVGFSSLGAANAPSTTVTSAAFSNSQVFFALRSASTSSIDLAAVTALPVLRSSLFGISGENALDVQANAFRYNANNSIVGYIDGFTRLDDDRSINNSTLSLNTSVAKVLGLRNTLGGAPLDYAATDGSIILNSNSSFDFDPRDGVSPDKFDFVGVAVHEFGRILGFRSGVDSYDQFTRGSNFTPADRTGGLESNVVATQMDLFRYVDGELDWSTVGQSYFSVDGGVSQLLGRAPLDTGVRNGDGRSAAFFAPGADGSRLGVMDATVGRGTASEITSLDVAALDAMGWSTSFDAGLNRNYRLSTVAFANALQSGVPEPGTWTMMLLGFGGIGYALRRRPNVSTHIGFT